MRRRDPSIPIGDDPRSGAGPRGLLLGFAAIALLLLAWEAAVAVMAIPPYILPPPSRVLTTLVANAAVIAPEALVTSLEILGGFAVGTLAGIGFALVMARSPLLERALGPLLVVSQALPVFAIAPLLVVWLGFGYASKLAMASLIIFFPVAASFLEGLRRADPGLLDLGRLYGASPAQRLLLLQMPGALPQLAAGLRVAAAAAPIGAIVGEWVGASAGLGLLMLHANARSQIDLVFAALLVLTAMSLALWAAVGALTRRFVRFAPDSLDTRSP
jgi:putative hydroxymethylpyrimidine transport system permease protein